MQSEASPRAKRDGASDLKMPQMCCAMTLENIFYLASREIKFIFVQIIVLQQFV